MGLLRVDLRLFGLGSGLGGFEVGFGRAWFGLVGLGWV